MFEDAYLSGILTLRSRKIKDFPAHFCAKYDLSDLISADLSLNRLNELPACMCELESLETLQLRSNSIQRLPSTIHLLKSLSFLDLSGNQLQSLPPTLFFLRLKVLLLGGNKIASIPREIRQLENCLLELDLSYNSLVELPSDITLLKSLKILNLSHNELIDLPQDIGFMQLRSLNIEDNCLTSLPLEFFNLSGFLISLKANGNPFVSPPVNVILKGREHIFKWLRSQSVIENSQNCNDWAFNRCTTINATLRRPDRILVDQSHPKSSDPTSNLRKVERRPRQNRFNTIGGSDSGYASTGDENRLSHEMIMSKGSLEEINETFGMPSPSSSARAQLDREVSGDLAKEVMLAYAETVIEQKMASRGAPISPPSATISPNTTAAMDVSNNNIPEKKPEVAKVNYTQCKPEEKLAPKALEETSDESQASDVDYELPTAAAKMEETIATPPLSSTSNVGLLGSSESRIQKVPTKNISSIAKPTSAPSKLISVKPTRSMTTPPESKVASIVKKTTVSSRLQPSTTTSKTVTTKSLASSGIRKPSLSNSKISPANSSTAAPRKSDPTKTSRMAASTTNLSAKAKSIDSTTAAIPPPSNGSSLRKPAPSGMSRSAITPGIHRKPNLGSQPSLPTSTGGSIVDSMKKIIEGKLAGIILPIDKDRLSQELSNGVHLCNFANKIRIRAVPIVFTPSEANLSPLKAKRNADGFIAACKRLGVPENSLCTSTDIIERNNLPLIARTVLALNKLALSNGSITTVASRV